MRVRKLSPTERLYLVCDDLFPPFAIQFLLTLTSLPSVIQLEDALIKVAQVNPCIQFEVQGRWWVNKKRTPSIRIYPGYAGELIDAPLLKERIRARGPACELVIWQNKGLLFRASHTLMDAGGLLFWVEELCRALRGEELLGTSSMLSDHDFLKSLKYPSTRRAISLNYPALNHEFKNEVV